MDTADVAILSMAGVVMQFLRGYGWFGQWATVGAAAAVSSLMVLLNHHPASAQEFVPAFVAHLQDVFAALYASHLVAHGTNGKLMPKFNQLSGGPQ